VLVGEIVCKREIPAELFEASLALGTGAIGVNHATDSSEVAGLELGYCGADPGNTAHDLMAGDARVNSGHDIAPLITDLMKVGVTDTAEENFDLYVVFCWIASRDRTRRKGRRRTGGRVSLGFVHPLTVERPQVFQYANSTIAHDPTVS
jgi:hypothetical protein